MDPLHELVQSLAFSSKKMPKSTEATVSMMELLQRNHEQTEKMVKEKLKQGDRKSAQELADHALVLWNALIALGEKLP